MPKIHEYKDDTGYFIYARPSDAGNITYGIDEVAYPIFDELGYEHKDQISWQVIQALVQTGLDDTNGEGTKPDPDPVTFETKKSTDVTDRQEFYELLKTIKTLSAEDDKRVRETLGIAEEPIEAKQSESQSRNESADELESWWKSRTEKTLDKELRQAFTQMSTEHILNGQKHHRSIAVTKMGDDYQEDYIVILEEPKVDDNRIVEYRLTVGNSLLVDLDDRHELSREARAEAFSHVAIIDELFRKYEPSYEASTPTVELRF